MKMKVKEFVQLLNNIRRLYRVRNNPEVEGTFGHQLNALQENENLEESN